MKQYIINQFHIHGNYIAGDLIDIHDNPNSAFYQGQHQYSEPMHPSCAEDVTPIVAHAPCPFLVPDRLAELRLYTQEQFETMFRDAVESDAKTLAAFLKKYHQLGLLDFRGMDKKEIFAELQAYFPSMKRYCYRNFTVYF